MELIEELKQRGIVNQITDEQNLKKTLDNKKIKLYVGIDPTGSSMHVGHLLPFTLLKRFQFKGHKPTIVLGGATGSIGDPSGKKSERELLSSEQVEKNSRQIKKQLEKLFGKDGFEIVNNNEWLGQISLIEFLRDYGKSFPINVMLKRDIIASRLEAGVSFTEFTYQILQSIDFLNLYKLHDVQLQIGGSDQWGNISSGVELIHKNEKDSKDNVFGLTTPLLLKSDGTKFGKSEGGTVWLDKNITSPFAFYQFWVNQKDDDVIKLLNFFTFLSLDKIKELEEEMKNSPEKRTAQKRLAAEMTNFVHGEEETKKAIDFSQKLFSGDVWNLKENDLKEIFSDSPIIKVNKKEINIIDLLTSSEIIEKSRRQAREDVKNGSITIDGNKINDIDATINFDNKNYLLVKKGKKKYYLVQFEENINDN